MHLDYKNISKYTPFFHDGSFLDIRHLGGEMVVSMSSAEVHKEDLQDDIPLSKNNRIEGQLHIEGIKYITVNDKPFFGSFKQKYEDGEILDFIITRNSVELGVLWSNYTFKIDESDFTTIKIEAEKIWWETIPGLEDLYP